MKVGELCVAARGIVKTQLSFVHLLDFHREQFLSFSYLLHVHVTLYIYILKTSYMYRDYNISIAKSVFFFYPKITLQTQRETQIECQFTVIVSTCNSYFGKYLISSPR